MNAIDIVRSALRDLPYDPDEIAAKLEANGIRSIMSCPNSCAIAEYLQDRLMAAGFVNKTVRVSTTVARLMETDHTDVLRSTVNLPAAATRFIARFDAGRYPQLVDVQRSRARLQKLPIQGAVANQLARLDRIEKAQEENT